MYRFYDGKYALWARSMNSIARLKNEETRILSTCSVYQEKLQYYNHVNTSTMDKSCKATKCEVTDNVSVLLWKVKVYRTSRQPPRVLWSWLPDNTSKGKVYTMSLRWNFKNAFITFLRFTIGIGASFLYQGTNGCLGSKLDNLRCH